MFDPMATSPFTTYGMNQIRGKNGLYFYLKYFPLIF